MTERVILFIDYQNAYRGARESFFPLHASHWQGQLHPLRLGQLLVDRSPYSRHITEVRVYRGLPDSTKDPRGYAASSRQRNAWTKSGVTVITRTLRYPRNWSYSRPAEKPQEKGIDVALAIDYVVMALRSEYDAGILMSTDTDLKPALEVVANLPNVRAEVCAWSAPNAHSRRLSISGARLWCHWLDQGDYAAVADPTDYNRP